MADKNQANSSTKHAEINMNGNLNQQIIESSVASITKNKSNDGGGREKNDSLFKYI